MNYRLTNDTAGWSGAHTGASPARPNAIGSEGRAGPPAEPLLATASQVAKLLQISTRTLWRLLSGGKVPEPLRIGGAVRWRLDEMKHWIAVGCPEPSESSKRKL